MVNNICKKTDFKAFYKNDIKNAYEVRFGYEPIMESGNETIFCQYAVDFFYHKPSGLDIDKCFERSSKNPSMEEVKTILEGIGLTSNEMIPLMKKQLKRSISKFDKKKGKDGVENFTISGIDVWMDKDTRTGLLLRFQAEKAVGKTDTVLWHEGMQFPLVVDKAIQMLYAIEVYASQTYDKTAEHLAAVDKLASVDALIAYNYKAGYPAQLAF